jgi:formylglycine-generating enzyme required for sulfatase activity
LRDIGSAGHRVIRGGDFSENPLRCRSTHRKQNDASVRANIIGLRPTRKVLPP